MKWHVPLYNIVTYHKTLYYSGSAIIQFSYNILI